MERTLRPRDLGDILKETFIIYKNNFWRFAAIISIVAIPTAIIGLAFNLFSPARGEMTTAAMVQFIILMIVLIPVSIAIFVASFLMLGAVIHAVSDQYFNRPISIGRAYRFSWHRLGGMIGAGILAGLAIAGIFIVAAIAIAIAAAVGGASNTMGTVLFVGVLVIIALSAILYLGTVWNFMFQAALVEGYGPMAALSRSLELVRQSWWRVFGILLLFYVIEAAITLILNLPGTIYYIIRVLPGFMSGHMTPAMSQEPAWLLIATTVAALAGNIIATPIFVIGQTLLYFDLRVRKEGYNLGRLAAELDLPVTSSDTTISPPQ